MNYSQAQLDQLDRLTERWVADHLQKGKTSKKDKELVTLELVPIRQKMPRGAYLNSGGASGTLDISKVKT